MDAVVAQAMAKWPNVPAVYGWLALDRRGNWLIKRERIANQALREFIARNYEADAAGRWYFQNGPQRVFVALDCTPYVFRLDERRESWLAHTGGLSKPAGPWVKRTGGQPSTAAVADGSSEQINTSPSIGWSRSPSSLAGR